MPPKIQNRLRLLGRMRSGDLHLWLGFQWVEKLYHSKSSMLGNPSAHYHHQMLLITKRLLRYWSFALSQEVAITGPPNPPWRLMFRISLCHIFKATKIIPIRSVSGRLIVGQPISQKSSIIGCTKLSLCIFLWSFPFLFTSFSSPLPSFLMFTLHSTCSHPKTRQWNTVIFVQVVLSWHVCMKM